MEADRAESGLPGPGEEFVQIHPARIEQWFPRQSIRLRRLKPGGRHVEEVAVHPRGKSIPERILFLRQAADHRKQQRHFTGIHPQFKRAEAGQLHWKVTPPALPRLQNK